MLRCWRALGVGLLAAIPPLACGSSGTSNGELGLPSVPSGDSGGSRNTTDTTSVGKSGTGGTDEGSGGSGTAGSGTAGSGSSASGGAGGASSGVGGSGGGGGSVPSCAPVPRCDEAPPDPGSKRGFRSSSPIGKANHRGRDLFLNPGDPQWVIGKFAYGLNEFLFDKDLKGEDVEIYLLRGCSGSWEKLGTAVTTEEDVSITVEGVANSGGQVFFQIPKNKELGVGRHRIHMVVLGDLTTADAFIEVVPRGTPIFVSDVDGTLTTSENEEFSALLSGSLPAMNTDASKAFSLIVERGYRPMYLTARPEFLVARTRQFLSSNGFPPGIVHTTLTFTGATGDAAASFKSAELKALQAKGLVPSFAFGNTITDAQAYASVPIVVDHRFFFQFTDTEFGGKRIEAYTELLDPFSALTSACQ